MAIVNNRASLNFISSNLAKCIKMAPNLPFNKTYSTDELNYIITVRAYLSLPIRFRNFVALAPAIVLPNKSFNILI